MILLLVFAIVSTVLTCSYGGVYEYFYQGSITEMKIIETNYSQVFYACNISQSTTCKIGYKVRNTDVSNVRIYYELLQIKNSSLGEKFEACDGSCKPGNIYVCCDDDVHKPKFIRVTVENLKIGSPVILESLGVEYQVTTNYYLMIIIIMLFASLILLLLLPIFIYIGIYISACISLNTPKNEHEYVCCLPCYCRFFGKKSSAENPYDWCCCFGKKSRKEIPWVYDKCCIGEVAREHFIVTNNSVTRKFRKSTVKSNVQKSNNGTQVTNTDTQSVELEDIV